jgi:hypothetical protein
MSEQSFEIICDERNDRSPEWMNLRESINWDSLKQKRETRLAESKNWTGPKTKAGPVPVVRAPITRKPIVVPVAPVVAPKRKPFDADDSERHKKRMEVLLGLRPLDFNIFSEKGKTK